MASASQIPASASPTTTTKSDCQRLDNERSSVSSPTPIRTPSNVGSNFSTQDALDSIGFHTDGRVKNPVPTKLQGMTNNKNGNFSVMHIDLFSAKPSERNAAARRTSEETEAQAKRANQVGWQPIRRSRTVWHSEDTNSQPTTTSKMTASPSRAAVTLGTALPAPATTTILTTSPITTTTPSATAATTLTTAAVAAAAATAPTITASSPAKEWLQTRIPAPHETKTEQARLLTLLRSIHPIYVVDQLCKALAYFGGIPGAPPPPSGTFPSGASTNGPGSLLVSWLSEIFPPVDEYAAMNRSLNLPHFPSGVGQNDWDRQEITTATTQPEGPVRRARGRPKGSKSSKVRKDKGIKKTRPAMGLASGSSNPNQPQTAKGRSSNAELSAAAVDCLAPSVSHQNMTKDDLMKPIVSISNPPGARKRGRPKGSKNRPKDKSNLFKGANHSNMTGPSLSAQNPTTSPMPRPPTGHERPEIPQGMPKESAPPMHSLPDNTAENEPSISVTSAGTKSLPDGGLLPSPYVGAFSGRGQNAEQDGSQKGTVVPNPPPHLRASKRPVQYSSQASPVSIGSNPGSSAVPATSPMPIDQLAKRRRLSRETGQQQQQEQQDTDMISHVLHAPPSPGLNDDFNSNSPQLSTSGSLDSRKLSNSRPSNTTMISSQPISQPQHQMHQSQLKQQPQRFYAQSQSSGIGMADQHCQTSTQPSGPARPKSQKAGDYDASRRAGLLSPAVLYTPQQQQQQSPVADQVGSLSHTVANIGRSMSGNHQYSPNLNKRDSEGSSRSPEQAQQSGIVTAARRHAPQDRVGQTQGFPEHVQTTSQPQAIGSYQGYNEHSYLNMDYGLTERDVQEAAAITALGSPSALDVVISQSKMRGDHMFQSIERQ